jgi:tetratricopeptide (TPR) repeat protein
VVHLLRAYFGVQDADAYAVIRERVVAGLRALAEEGDPSVTPFLSLLDVPIDDPLWHSLDPPTRRRRTLDALRDLVLRESQRQPLLLVFEDLHWIDSETQSVLDVLAESLAGAPLLLLVTSRPDYAHRGDGAMPPAPLRLDPLGAEHVDELLNALLGDAPGLAPLKASLLERTEGNPFFVEESVQTLVETGALVGERGRYRLTQPLHALQVPATVQGVLAARIDRLESEEKALLQSASVIGKDVPFVLLQAISELSDEALHRRLTGLRTGEFLREPRRLPDPEYTFKHALTQEVAYGSLLQERRRQLHASIVHAIETLHRDRLAEQVEHLAHHATRGELGPKAVHYLREAGRKAAVRSALQDARDWFEQALGVLQTLPETPVTLEQAFDIRLELRPILTQLGDIQPSLDCLREAEAVAERLNDDRRRGRVAAFLAFVQSSRGALDEAVRAGTRSLEIAGRLGDAKLRVLGTSYLGYVLWLCGDYERVVELTTANLATAIPGEWAHEYFVFIAPPAILDRCSLVLSLAELGRFAAAVDREAEMVRLAEPTQHAYILVQTYRAAAILHLLENDWAKARAATERWLGVARTRNVTTHLPIALAASSWVLAHAGEVSEARDQRRESRLITERLTARGYAINLGWTYHALGRASFALGEIGEAWSLGTRAVECARSYPGAAAHAWHLLGDIAAHRDRGDAERAEALYRRALTLAEPRHMRPLVAHCHLGLGTLFRQTGRRDLAREQLALALTMYRALAVRAWPDRAEAELRPLG